MFRKKLLQDCVDRSCVCQLSLKRYDDDDERSMHEKIRYSLLPATSC